MLGRWRREDPKISLASQPCQISGLQRQREILNTHMHKYMHSHLYSGTDTISDVLAFQLLFSTYLSFPFFLLTGWGYRTQTSLELPSSYLSFLKFAVSKLIPQYPAQPNPSFLKFAPAILISGIWEL